MATTYIRTGEELRALSAQSNPVDLTFGRQFFESLIQWDFPQIYPINPWYHDSKSGNLYFRFLPWNWNEASVCYPHAAIAQILLDLLNSEQENSLSFEMAKIKGTDIDSTILLSTMQEFFQYLFCKIFKEKMKLYREIPYICGIHLQKDKCYSPIWGVQLECLQNTHSADFQFMRQQMKNQLPLKYSHALLEDKHWDQVAIETQIHKFFEKYRSDTDFLQKQRYAEMAPGAGVEFSLYWDIYGLMKKVLAGSVLPESKKLQDDTSLSSNAKKRLKNITNKIREEFFSTFEKNLFQYVEYCDSANLQNNLDCYGIDEELSNINGWTIGFKIHVKLYLS